MRDAVAKSKKPFHTCTVTQDLSRGSVCLNSNVYINCSTVYPASSLVLIATEPHVWIQQTIVRTELTAMSRRNCLFTLRYVKKAFLLFIVKVLQNLCPEYFPTQSLMLLNGLLRLLHRSKMLQHFALFCWQCKFVNTRDVNKKTAIITELSCPNQVPSVILFVLYGVHVWKALIFVRPIQWWAQPRQMDRVWHCYHKK